MIYYIHNWTTILKYHSRIYLANITSIKCHNMLLSSEWNIETLEIANNVMDYYSYFHPSEDCVLWENVWWMFLLWGDCKTCLNSGSVTIEFCEHVITYLFPKVSMFGKAWFDMLAECKCHFENMQVSSIQNDLVNLLAVVLLIFLMYASCLTVVCLLCT